MSQQVENAVTSSSKRTYRKGNPVSAKERQRLSLARRSATHKAFHAIIQIRLKDKLSELADEEGITQAQMLERLIESELKRRNSL
ncbi:replication regulatory protein RepA [Salmonella enterica]|uniref:Protein CopB n=4 Tax=Salmonella enterica TaxID=28901 RepID=A0A5X8Y2K3_SALNE|nr:transcriptional regulator [Salmonella enterica subsp. enterica serovar Java]EAO1481101.1 replication regulatory protein RepA [Salmonella enterica]EAW1322289.1 replication regulatory protein RepA [Salmonella enterica subsp. diarizonae]EBS2908583.1 transcriptional regulator [Salmonella enterica subsp. enterica serovar Flottbek]EBS4086132.1 transcriptional regulator [Salmonella enterica subsp. enterica serovar Newport]ECJ2934675.1 replication regulatory protein RepA [Salmonella enterica subsp.